jgi:hypothetical protein
MRGRHTATLPSIAEVFVMFARRLCVLLVVVLGAWPCAARAQQVPRNVAAGVLAGDVIDLQRRSGTFRAQCDRIAADARVRVRLAITDSVENNGRAQTRFRRYPNGAIVADVAVLFGDDYRELLAHEFEHVIEQLDGVDLRREAAAGRAWQVANGVFETRRASIAGAQAAREADAAHAHAMPPLLR